jgi:hypothetical protein
LADDTYAVEGFWIDLSVEPEELVESTERLFTSGVFLTELGDECTFSSSGYVSFRRGDDMRRGDEMGIGDSRAERHLKESVESLLTIGELR